MLLAVFLLLRMHAQGSRCDQGARRAGGADGGWFDGDDGSDGGGGGD